MHAIGITGGIGSGKSEILNYLENRYHSYIIRADEVGHKMIEKGNVCYPAIVELLGDDILNEDQSVDRKKMADKIFADEGLRKRVNSIIHPAVKDYILIDLEKQSELGVSWYFVEAALLVEEDYGSFLDEIWYVYSSEKNRAKRLKESRNYSEDKIAAIMDSQLTDEAYENYCDILIDNDGKIEETFAQIDVLMK